MKKTVQHHVCFVGNVQGVGFRRTCEKIALRIGLKGWVMNLPDGSVEVLAWGSEEEFEFLLLQLNKIFSIETTHPLPFVEEVAPDDFRMRR